MYMSPAIRQAGASDSAMRWSSYVSNTGADGSQRSPSQQSVSRFSSVSAMPNLRSSALRASMRSVSFILRLYSPVKRNVMSSMTHVTTTVCARSGELMKS